MSNKSILSFDFREQQKRNELWIKNREYRGNIYRALGEYIEFLEKILPEEKDDYQIYLIEKKIKKLKKLQEKYYDPCILSMKLPGNDYGENEKTTESRPLIKRLFNKKI